MKDKENDKNYQELFSEEPWPEAVDAKWLFESLQQLIRSFVRLSVHEAIAATLWVIHTYFIRKPKEIQVCSFSPILQIFSPEKACGKSTLMEVLADLCPRSRQASNISAAAIYRIIELNQPTLFIDEADTFFANRSEIIGILNDGYRQAGCVTKQGGRNFEQTLDFHTWGAKCIAGIGRLSATLESRCIQIRLKKKLPSEVVLRRSEALSANPNLFLDFRRKLIRFAIDNEDTLLASSEVTQSVQVDDRTRDNWSGLLKIANQIHEEIYRESIEAVQSLSDHEDEEDSDGIELLRDIRELQHSGLAGWVASKRLAKLLMVLPDSRWTAYSRLGLSTYDLARLLRPFQIYPMQHKIEGVNQRAYDMTLFEDVFVRYLGD
jgi:putative DNA primase/helicase